MDGQNPRLLPLLVGEVRELSSGDRVPLQELREKLVRVGKRGEGGNEGILEFGVLGRWVGKVDNQLIQCSGGYTHGDVDIHGDVHSLSLHFVPDVEPMGGFDLRVFNLDKKLEEFEESGREFFSDCNIFHLIWFGFRSTMERERISN